MKKYFSKIGVEFSLILTIVSIVIFCISLIGLNYKQNNFEVLIFFSLMFAFIYGVIFTFRVLKNREKHKHIVPFLFLNWFLGCFSLNVLIPIFENLPVWVYITTFLFCVSNFFIYNDFKHKIMTPVSYFVNGTSFLLIIYFMIYLFPFMPISAIGIIALGIGFYGLVPCLVSVLHTIRLLQIFKNDKKNTLPFLSGIGSVFIGIALFVGFLYIENEKMNSHLVTKTFDTNEDLPTYIKASQNLTPNFLNEILLKKEIVYIYTDDFLTFRGFDGIGKQQYNERKIHNPIINVGYFFLKNCALSEDDRINILKSNFDKRLETEEQLWSGQDLVTKNIKEDVKVFGNEHLAYTEVTMDVACEKDSWGDKEAIYSFQLPEGAVATSLSLWVNGIERKGVLTTKEKAQAAYKQIVKVESRDPSLMQWKEGNRVVVRVFPIRYDLPRTFKCGFTIPLQVKDDALIYNSLQIKGPNLTEAQTLSRIQFVENNKFESTKDFELTNGFYINESKGLDSWQVTIPETKNVVSPTFVWENQSYSIQKMEKQIISFTPKEIILDINKNWNKEELEAILSENRKDFFVFINNEKQAINKDNGDLIYEQLKTYNYTLLPFYKMQENALVITKNSNFSANFEELEDSEYLKKIKNSAPQKNIRVLALSSQINPFWQTIKEQKYVDYVQSDLKETIDLINNNQFIKIKTEENLVNLENAEIAIVKNKADARLKSTGSDHIFRMYAFGKVLNEQVKIQSDSLAKNNYVDLAKEANIVTPISSLIVLETDEDYKKNGIEKNVNTLGNASIKNHGAVPEPYEWVLIIVGALSLFYYYRQQKAKKIV